MQLEKEDKSKKEDVKQCIAAAFSHIRSLADVPALDLEWKNKSVVDVQACIMLETPEGHQPEWKEVYLNACPKLETLKGFQEGLTYLEAKDCQSLAYPIDLPYSCKKAIFDFSGLKGLQNANGNPMTDGLETLSINECADVVSLSGLPSTCKKLYMQATRVNSFAFLPYGIEVVDAAHCLALETTRGLPETCKELNLSFSGIKRLESIPKTIEKIVMQNCYYFDVKSLFAVPPEVLPRIETADPCIKQQADILYQKWIQREQEKGLKKVAEHHLKTKPVVELNKDDVIYKVKPEAVSMAEVIKDIPSDVTVIDASNCEALSNLEGLEKFKKLRIASFANTSITSFELRFLPPSIQYIDILGCKEVRSLARLFCFDGLNVISNIRSDKILHSTPNTVTLWIDGLNNKAAEAQKRLVLSQKVRE